MEAESLSLPAPQPLAANGERLLAFEASERFSSLAKRSALQEAPGWIVRGEEIEPWRFGGYQRHGDRLLLVGPYHAGEMLAAALERGPEAAVAALARLAAALVRLTATVGFDERIQLNGIYLLADGGVLLFPPRLVRQLTEVQQPDAVLAAGGRINHPDLSGRDRLAVTLAILSYRAVTGTYPYAAAEEEQLHNQMRSLELVPAAVRTPGLAPELAQLIARSLDHHRQPTRPATTSSRPDLEQWASTLQRVHTGGVVQPVGDAERAGLELEVRTLETRFDQTLRRRVFLQRNWRTMVIVALVVVAGGALLGSLVANQLKPRTTRGFSPRQVVAAYYTSIGRLDHQIMDDAVIDGAGKAVIDEVISLFVVSRVQQGYEGRANLVDAAEWVATGQPELPAGVMVYGPSHLEIVAEQGPPQPIFRVSYLMWRPDRAGNGQAADAAQRPTPMSERVVLRQHRDDWVIFQFDRLAPPVGLDS